MAFPTANPISVGFFFFLSFTSFDLVLSFMCVMFVYSDKEWGRYSLLTASVLSKLTKTRGHSEMKSKMEGHRQSEPSQIIPE